jgi:hypothetical protein
MPVLELLVVIVAIPGAIEALCNLWTLRPVGRHGQRLTTTELAINLSFSIHRTRARRSN